jgi:proprotein convertase subtilisin/kexin type 2
MKLVPLGLVCAIVMVNAACGGTGGTTAGTTPTAAPAPGPTATPTSAPAPNAAPYQNESACIAYNLTSSNPSSGVDPLSASQWHLQNTGQSGGVIGEDMRAVAAWITTKGSGTRVAVIDDAIEVTHPDLSPNVVAGGSFSYRSGVNKAGAFPLPCTINDDHGTAVAGLITARDGNAIGVAGVAPRASLVGYNALATNLDTDIADALLRDGALVGVYNNSWGSPDDGQLHAAESAFKTAIANGIEKGRAGKGAIYVFPSGNGGCYTGQVRLDGSCTGDSDNANFDGYTNFLGVNTVCATSDKGTKPWYSEVGANVLVCGVSSDRTANVSTTDITGRSSGGGYRSDFSGTSASTPMVSGVVALMLAVRPELTWRDVRLILAETARKNDASNALWTNNFGFNYHPSYAFGVANAQTAVARAANWVSVGNSSTLQSCGPFNRTVSLPIADATGTSSANAVPGPTVEDSQVIATGSCGITKIEYIEVKFAATHTASGDLRVRLVSPNGLVSELASARVCQGSCGSYGDASGANPWGFGSVRHLGENVAGGWRLQVNDMIPVDTGTVRNWSIRFWGR